MEGLVRWRVDGRAGEIREEVTFGVSSLPPAGAGPHRLLRRIRGCWQIENRLHHDGVASGCRGLRSLPELGAINSSKIREVPASPVC